MRAKVPRSLLFKISLGGLSTVSDTLRCEVEYKHLEASIMKHRMTNHLGCIPPPPYHLLTARFLLSLKPFCSCSEPGAPC